MWFLSSFVCIILHNSQKVKQIKYTSKHYILYVENQKERRLLAPLFLIRDSETSSELKEVKVEKKVKTPKVKKAKVAKEE